MILTSNFRRFVEFDGEVSGLVCPKCIESVHPSVETVEAKDVSPTEKCSVCRREVREITNN